MLLNLDYAQYSACLAKCFGIQPCAGEMIAVDGKHLRGSYQLASEAATPEPHPAIQLVSVYLVERDLILEPFEVERKGNEIKVSGQVSKRAGCVVLGINREGNKELLGLWIGETAAAGAKFWLKVLTDLKNRGLKDILIACCDGLIGFPQAIEALYPKTQVQLCIVHLIRNCLCYVPWKDSKAVAADLKPIDQVTTLAEAEAALDAFDARWDDRYPAISQIWIHHWDNIIPLFDYPMDIRRVICHDSSACESH